MNYLATLTNVLGIKYFFEVKILDDDANICGYASVIIRKWQMVYCDICVKEKYEKNVSEKAISGKCEEIISANEVY